MQDQETTASPADSESDADPDAAIVARVLRGETRLFETILRRYNRRLFRTARAILGDDAEAEDAMQEAYVQAFRHLDQFHGSAAFSTWLTRILVHEAGARLRRRRARAALAPMDDGGDEAMATVAADPHNDPEKRASEAEVRRVLEDAVDALPETFRAVFVLRAVEELSGAETAACLEIPEETVKTRLHRARAQLQTSLLARMDGAANGAFDFQAPRCDRIAERVLARITAVDNTRTGEHS